MKSWSTRLAVLSLLAGAVLLPGHTRAAPKKKPDNLMQKKLTAAQKVLEGIATEDFDLVRENADALQSISTQAGWKAKGKTHKMYLLAFQNAAEDLVKHAKKKNADAAALSYVELTLTCVKCHKHVRDRKETAALRG